ncbi:MAG: hypothetical protein AAFN94_00840 [Pseudomonadota bacterium]
MARHSGKNGIAKLSGTVVVGVTAWDIEETAEVADTTGFGDAWNTHVPLQNSWSGSMTFNADDAEASQAIRAGDTIPVELYSDGDASGKTYYSGNVTVTSVGRDVALTTTVTKSVQFTGNGALDIATVA